MVVVVVVVVVLCHRRFLRMLVVVQTQGRWSYWRRRHRTRTLPRATTEAGGRAGKAVSAAVASAHHATSVKQRLPLPTLPSVG